MKVALRGVQPTLAADPLARRPEVAVRRLVRAHLMSADEQDVLRVRQAGLGPSMALVKPLSPTHVQAALRLGRE